MTLDPKDLDELKKLSTELGMNFTDIVDQLNKGTISLEQFKTYMTGLRAQAKIYNTELDYTVSSYAQILNQLGKQNQGLKLANSSISSLSDIARKVLNSQQGLADLSVKELNSLRNKVEIKISDLRLALEIAKATKANQEEINNINDALTRSTNIHGSLLQFIDRETIRIEKQNEILGLTGNTVKGLSALFDKLGLGGLGNVLGLDDALKNAQEKARELSFDMTEAGKIKLSSEVNQLTQRLQESEDKVREYNALWATGKINQDEFNKLLDEEDSRQKEINKQIDEKNKRLNQANNGISLFGAKLTILKGSIKDIGVSLISNLKDPLVLLGMMGLGFKNILDSALRLNKESVEFSRMTGQNVNYSDSLNMSLTTTTDYLKTINALSKEFGINAQAAFSPETLREATEMVELMGMTAQQAGTFASFAKMSGKDMKTTNENIVNQTGNFIKNNRLAINQRQIFEEVSKVSKATAVSLGGNAERIAAAALEAKKLGMTLDQVDKIASSLLDFESSIAAELEAELLTGQQLNLEQARYFALTNDINGLTKEIQNNQEVLNAFSSGNRIQQESIAKALGMSREELANSVYEAQLIKGLTEEQAAKAADVNLEDMKRLDIQKQINNSIDKMSEALAIPLSMFADLLSNSWALYGIMGMIGVILTTQLVKGMVDFGMSILKAIPGLSTMLGLETGIASAKMSALAAGTLGIGVAIALAAAIAGIAALKSSINSASTPRLAKGGIITEEINNATIGEAGPEAVIPLNSPKAKEYLGGNTSSPSMDLTPLLEAINRLEAAINSRPIMVETKIELDGQQIAYNQSTGTNSFKS